MIMPENAGGRAAQTAEASLGWEGIHMRPSGPTASMASGIMTKFENEPMKTWLLNVILTEESVIPAANTATEAFAPAMRIEGRIEPSQPFEAAEHEDYSEYGRPCNRLFEGLQHRLPCAWLLASVLGRGLGGVAGVEEKQTDRNAEGR